MPAPIARDMIETLRAECKTREGWADATQIGGSRLTNGDLRALLALVDKIEALRGLGHGFGAVDLVCGDPECCICAVLDCPHGEPMHHHHDGCPACTQEPG